MAGLAINILSASQTWAHQMPPGLLVPASALYVSRKVVEQNAFQLKIGWLSVGWILVMAGAIPALMLLTEPSAAEKPLFLKVQVFCGCITLAAAILYFKPQLGVALACLSGSILIAGALKRYR
jgi:hypothetical protein